MIPLPRAVARACRARQWVLNEKMLVARAGLTALHDRFTRIPAAPVPLAEWVSGLGATLTAA